MIDLELDKIFNKIFENYDLNILSDYEKRRIIFNYLSDNLSYDSDLLEQIKSKTARRNPLREIMDVLENKKGICNGIAQVYMLLLERVGIKSVCICCDDSTEVFHQLNLVKNGDGFSFDDVTNGIFSSNNETYFDYDIENAHIFGQGNRIMFDDLYWCIIEPSYVYAIISKEYKDNIAEFNNYVQSINSKKFSR